MKIQRMRGTSPEVALLTTFLNLDLGKPGGSVLADFAGPSLLSGATPEAVAFAKAHDLIGHSLLLEIQTNLRFHLQHLLDPESIIPIRANKEVRDGIKRDIVDKYFSNPQRVLLQLLATVNRANMKTELAQSKTDGNEGNLHVRGYQWRLRKKPLGGKAKVCQWLIGVLERDELSRLGSCRTCGRFFIRRRRWQRTCDKTCKTTYDNVLSRERKRTRDERKEVEQAETRKNEMFKILKSQTLRKRLRGGPTERLKTQVNLIKALERSSSVEEFFRGCTPEVKRTVKKEMESSLPYHYRATPEI